MTGCQHATIFIERGPSVRLLMSSFVKASNFMLEFHRSENAPLSAVRRLFEQSPRASEIRLGVHWRRRGGFSGNRDRKRCVNFTHRFNSLRSILFILSNMSSAGGFAGCSLRRLHTLLVVCRVSPVGDPEPAASSRERLLSWPTRRAPFFLFFKVGGTKRSSCALTPN